MVYIGTSLYFLHLFLDLGRGGVSRQLKEGRVQSIMAR